MNSVYDYQKLIGYKIIKGEVCIKRKILSVLVQNGYDITFEQWTVLNVLYAEPGLIQSEIAAKTYKDKTNITRILDVLEKKDYIEKRADGMDRRISCIYLTESGRKIFEGLIPNIEEVNNQFRNGISDSELEVFSNVLEKIYRNTE